MANYRSWGKQFSAYFDAGRFDALPCTQQQAFLNNCLDDVLRARINREASVTTPIYSNIPGFLTCSSILDSVFLESNPIHLRRKQLFDVRQKEGQTIIELLSLIEEADGDNIGGNDLICMMLQNGASEQNHQPHLVWQLKVPRRNAIRAHSLQEMRRSQLRIVGAMRGADDPHCQADASDARGRITCYPSVLTLLW